MKVWHKRKELPNTKEKTIVYVFDDGIDVEDYCLAFFYAGNLKKWAYWEDVQKAIKFYEELNKVTDVDDYMTMLRESQLKRTIVIDDVDKIISENKRLKELLKECKKEVDFEYEQLCRINDVSEDKNPTGYWQLESAKIGLKRILSKIDEVIK